MSATSATQQQQRDQALASANRVRLERAQVKQQIKRGERPIEAVLLDPPACVNTMPISDLLMSTPRKGRVRVNNLLSRARISPHRAVMALTERQRQQIVDELGRL